ncbi:MAG: TVP38/TMEM64 family protein [Chloroflexi bacterium]|nr:MAG: TVP38/TMEM64 family protein [Chloroflexota bacterium]RLT34174.1 MAG: TVP38/TMEM64 family protein [Chloroflexota bacterium]
MKTSFWSTLKTLLPRRRLLWLAVLAVVALAVLWWLRSVIDLTPSGMRTLLAPLGGWGALIVVVGIAVILVVPVVPATVLQVGAGLVFGPWLGFGLTLLGDLIGALVGFAIARRWGHQVVRTRLSAAEQGAFDDLCVRITPTGMLLLRVLPGPAYTLVSFAAGCSSMPWWQYLLGSLLGVAPGLMVLTVAGDLSTSNPGLAVGIAVGFVLLMVGISRIVRTRT